jgi:RNA polymerase sigma-70 factor (ECF subfamily)
VRRTVRARRLVTAAETPVDPPDPRTAVAADERFDVLQRLMAGLDEFDRALLLLHLEERSYREIADVLGLSESNVGTRLNRLRQHLRELATKEMRR